MAGSKSRGRSRSASGIPVSDTPADRQDPSGRKRSGGSCGRSGGRIVRSDGRKGRLDASGGHAASVSESGGRSPGTPSRAVLPPSHPSEGRSRAQEGPGGIGERQGGTSSTSPVQRLAQWRADAGAACMAEAHKTEREPETRLASRSGGSSTGRSSESATWAAQTKPVGQPY